MILFLASAVSIDVVLSWKFYGKFVLFLLIFSFFSIIGVSFDFRK
jgi:hypothetical protein